MKFLFLDLSLYVDRAVVEVMSAQGTQGEENPLVGVGHEIPGAEDGAQVIQLTQVQICSLDDTDQQLQRNGLRNRTALPGPERSLEKP